MKRVIELHAVMLLMCILLCACGGQEAGNTAATGSAEQASGDGSAVSGGGSETSDEGSGGQEPGDIAAAEPKRKAEDFIGVQFTYEGKRGSGEELGYAMDVNYTVPKILADGSGAEGINDDIRTFCLDVIEPDEEELAFPTWYEVSYEAYLNEDILSLVITKRCTMDDASAYAVFNYNVKDESVIDNASLLQSCGYTEASFTEQMRKAVAYEADENMQYLFDAPYWKSDDTTDAERQSMYAEYMRYRQNSIATERVNMQMPMYLDETGALKALAEIDTPAGAGTYTKAVAPRRESQAEDFEISFENALFITYRDGVMKIRMEDNDWTRNAFFGAGSLLEFGREYTVEGVYKDYVAGEMQFVADGEYAVPVFVSDDGMVSALNLYACAPAGYFCLTEPVMGLKGVEAITEVNGSGIADEVGKTLLGQVPGFAKNALGIYGQAGFQKNYTSLHEEDGYDTYGYYIGFDDQNEGRFLYQADELDTAYLCYSGECIWIGMNEDGLVFSSRVDADFAEPYDPDSHYTAFVLKKYGEWDDLLGDFKEWADFKSLGGFITLGGDGYMMTLDITYG